jgi:hypothetical protein
MNIYCVKCGYVWENIKSKTIFLYNDEFLCKKCPPDNNHSFINSKTELGWKNNTTDNSLIKDNKMLKCNRCNIEIQTPIHETGENIPPLRCINCDPSSNFTKYKWDGRTWKNIINLDNLDINYIKKYLAQHDIKCKTLSNNKIVNMIKDLDNNIYNFNKYSKNKSLLNKYKVNIDDENNGFILRIY